MCPGLLYGRGEQGDGAGLLDLFALAHVIARGEGSSEKIRDLLGKLAEGARAAHADFAAPLRRALALGPVADGQPVSAWPDSLFGSIPTLAALTRREGEIQARKEAERKKRDDAAAASLAAAAPPEPPLAAAKGAPKPPDKKPLAAAPVPAPPAVEEPPRREADAGPIADGEFDLKALPLFGSASNALPTCHVDDLAAYLVAVATHRPFQGAGYLLCADRQPTPQAALTRAIQSAFKIIAPTGSPAVIPKSKLVYVPGFTHLTLDAPLEKTAFKGAPEPGHTSFAERAEAVVQEFTALRGFAPLKVLLWGPPAGGKSYLGAWAARNYAVPHVHGKAIVEGIATLDPESQKTFSAGMAPSKANPKGGRLPDDQFAALTAAVLKQSGGRGFVLDGFPKTLAQAKALFDEHPELVPEVAFALRVDEDVLRERVAATERREKEEAAAALAAATAAAGGKAPAKPPAAPLSHNTLADFARRMQVYRGEEEEAARDLQARMDAWSRELADLEQIQADKQAALETLINRPNSAVVGASTLGGLTVPPATLTTITARGNLPPVTSALKATRSTHSVSHSVNAEASARSVSVPTAAQLHDPRVRDCMREIERVQLQLKKHAEKQPQYGGLLAYLHAKGAKIVPMSITLEGLNAMMDIDVHAVAPPSDDKVPGTTPALAPAATLASTASTAAAAAAAGAKKPAPGPAGKHAPEPVLVPVDPRRKAAEERAMHALRLKLKYTLGAPRFLGGALEPEPRLVTSPGEENAAAAVTVVSEASAVPILSAPPTLTPDALAPPQEPRASLATGSQKTAADPSASRPQTAQRPPSAAGAKPSTPKGPPPSSSKVGPRTGGKGKKDEPAFTPVEERRVINRPPPPLTETLAALRPIAEAEVRYRAAIGAMKADVIRGRAEPVVNQLVQDLVPAVTQAVIRTALEAPTDPITHMSALVQRAAKQQELSRADPYLHPIYTLPAV